MRAVTSSRRTPSLTAIRSRSSSRAGWRRHRVDDYGRASDRSPEIAHPVPTPPARLLDRDLVAVRLGVRRDEVMARISDPAFPDPAGYFRGRMLWEEAAVDAWVN